ncbi:unnamed protein product [Sphagnum balticum]
MRPPHAPPPPLPSRIRKTISAYSPVLYRYIRTVWVLSFTSLPSIPLLRQQGADGAREAAKNVVTEYDKKVMIPLLIKVNKLLNPTGDNTTIEIADFFANSLFVAPTSAEEIGEVLLVFEFSIFCRVVVLEPSAKPLTWWRDHANKFPNVAFLARQILGILDSQIETENFLGDRTTHKLVAFLSWNH